MAQTFHHSLPVIPPYDGPQIIDHLAFRALPAVETVDNGVWQRSLRLPDGAPAVITVGWAAETTALQISLTSADTTPVTERDWTAVLGSVSRVFDTATDPRHIRCVLEQDLRLAPLLKRFPGLRIPGLWDPFEAMMRAMLGQQVTVRAARTLGARLVERCGDTLPDALKTDQVTRLFPTPAAVAAADLTAFGMPGRRISALQALAARVAEDPSCLTPAATLDETSDRLCALPGIGPWTAHYVALRYHRFADAFPAADIGLLRAMEEDGVRPTPATLRARAERWRPWRAYAAQLLWTSDAGSL
ncbi:DNA-3-methyladenine glycosylase family protein [Novispirillum itersonii]|uniref:DNA-3-methyladenine glycosylase family protein n=1 Tax=Novispirillum itersonii TaxID=189 RepID=UPI0003736FA1|nr:AlkA N-terminal domain-containing protein [Novispirillum itersonii]